MEPFGANLNNAQRNAVTTRRGPTLVLAGAGTGKTTVIVERIAWLVKEQGVDPRHILALTFTNKAANEMRERVLARLNDDRLGAWLGTFHSFALFLLRRHIDVLERKRDFTVFDEDDQLALMKRLVNELPLHLPRVSPREAVSWISLKKQNLLEPEKVSVCELPEEHSYMELWKRYQAALIKSDAVDFDDLLVLSAQLLGQHETVRERYQRRYTHIHVDEYQDTNYAQNVILRHLANQNENLFVVGDEDQSIYSWRGALLHNILNFEKDFPNAQIIRLEQNYRSSGHILKAANALVAHNVKRLGKNLWTTHDDGEPVTLYEAEDSEAEARYVAEQLEKDRKQYNSVAVLFRTNGQSRMIEEALRLRGLPYVVIGGIQFYARKEVKDIIAYLRLIVNPNDDVALRRILNVPPRGIGETSLSRLDAYARERGISLFSAMRDAEYDQNLSPRMRENFLGFVHLIDDLALMSRTETRVAVLVKTLLERIAYREYVERTEGRGEKSRAEIVEEFVSSCAQHDERQTGGGLLGFLQDLALMSDFDQWDSASPAVTLMTCHAAKGLEFDEVFLVGLEEGLLPHVAAEDDPESIEEERRLCYVAMTRARKRLILTTARRRLQYGEWRDSVRSRFVDEIASCGELVLVLPQRIDEHPRDSIPAESRTHAQTIPGSTAAKDKQPLRMGMRVRHAKFGVGVVMFTSGSGKNLKARIKFLNGRSRDFLVSYAPIDIIEGEAP